MKNSGSEKTLNTSHFNKNPRAKPTVRAEKSNISKTRADKLYGGVRRATTAPSFERGRLRSVFCAVPHYQPYLVGAIQESPVLLYIHSE